VHQFALVYLFTPSTDVYSCPLAMTDGAAKALSSPPTARWPGAPCRISPVAIPSQFWTSGQWMTESTGGSDVGLSETLARRDDGGAWRLYGRKWFTSAVTSQMALTLARPEGNAAGGKGLALFFLETRGADGRLNGILVHRLKDKLGTRKVPTAELTLDGTVAEPVAGLADGVRNIAPMLNVTRTWNAVSAVSYMRRGVALARDFATRRVAFGSPLADKPLHADTLAGLQAETEAAFALTFCVVELLGREEAGEADAAQLELLRLLTPVAKLVTGKQSVAVLSEIVESFGGAGYVEDTGIPQLLRDAQVFPIWEGTTNVLSLDVLLRTDLHAGLAALMGRVSACVRSLSDPRLAAAGRQAMGAVERSALWLESGHDRDVLQASARRLALTLGRALQLALLCEHAQWLLDHTGDRRGLAAALRFSRVPVDLMHEVDPELDRVLLGSG
jgi:acyl-CoA dehydrogenase